MKALALSYRILFCFVVSLKTCSFLKETEAGLDLEGRGGRGKSGKWGTVVRMYCMRERNPVSIFKKRKKPSYSEDKLDSFLVFIKCVSQGLGSALTVLP